MNSLGRAKRIASASALLLGSVICVPALAVVNPMEQAGIEHNLYLECLEASKDKAISPLRRLVDECGYEPGMSTDDFVKRYQWLHEISPDTSLAVRLQSSTIKYSEYERTFFYRIDEIVATAASLEEATTRFSLLEQEAIENLSEKSSSGRSVLATFSTLRHSLEYWMAVEIDENTLVRGRDPKPPRWWIGLVIAVADSYFTGQYGAEIGSLASEIVSTVLHLIFD